VYGDGWHSLEIFYGKTDRFEQMIPQQEWYAQAKQDIIISRLFNEMPRGYFIDLAANSAAEISNTYSLERKFNWTGICIEPNHVNWSSLSFRDCQVVGAVVGATRMEEIMFQEAPELHPMGGIVGDEFDNHNADGAVPMYTVTISEVLERFHVPTEMDYLSLDVEGAEYFIMKHFPFQDYSFKVMTVERPKEDLRALFAVNGYELVGTISSASGETLWVRTDIKESLNMDSIKEFVN
jgi:Methyltransferase FkbM domain